MGPFLALPVPMDTTTSPTSNPQKEHKTSKENVESKKLASEGPYRTVFWHCESLRSSLSPTLHLTQLAAVVDQGDTFFRAVVPPGELVPHT